MSEFEEDITSKSAAADDEGTSSTDLEDPGSQSGDKNGRGVDGRIVRMEIEDLGREIQRSISKAARNRGFATSKAVRLSRRQSTTFESDL